MIEIDMKLPSCCDECFAFNDYGCMISGESCGLSFKSFENRMPSCPLKDNEPRVLTLEEVESSEDSVWLDKDLPEWEPMPVLVNEVGQHIDTFITRRIWRFQGEKSNGRGYGDYGKTWRCWSAKPTEEQRKAVKWDD